VNYRFNEENKRKLICSHFTVHHLKKYS